MGRNPVNSPVEVGSSSYYLIGLKIHPSRGNRLGISAINTSRDDFPFPKVGYVSFLEGKYV